MSYKEYPAWRFGPGATSVVVNSPEEDSLLGGEWSDKIPEGFQPEGHPTFRTAEYAAAEGKMRAAEDAEKARKAKAEQDRKDKEEADRLAAQKQPSEIEARAQANLVAQQKQQEEAADREAAERQRTAEAQRMKAIEQDAERERQSQFAQKAHEQLQDLAKKDEEAKRGPGRPKKV